MANEPERMYGWKEAARMVGLSVRQLREWIAEGRFPEPHKSGTTSRWFASEIAEWQLKFKLGLVPPSKKKA